MVLAEAVMMDGIGAGGPRPPDLWDNPVAADDATGARPIRVLIVDDSDDMRLLFRVVLDSDECFEVWGEAANGLEAIDLLGAGCPDAIVLDLMMPVMDGLTALPLLRERCSAAPVIVTTASTSAQLRTDALDLGAHGVIDKSGAMDELKSMLSRACAPGSHARSQTHVGVAAELDEAPIRGLVVDDHEVLGTSLARTLAKEPGIDVIEAAHRAVGRGGSKLEAPVMASQGRLASPPQP